MIIVNIAAIIALVCIIVHATQSIAIKHRQAKFDRDVQTLIFTKMKELPVDEIVRIIGGKK